MTYDTYEAKSTFYLAPELWHEPFILDSTERMHLAKVKRMAEGQKIYLIDGNGRSGLFIVKQITKDHVALTLVTEQYIAKPKSKAIMALAFSKAVRRDFFMEKSVELGVHSIYLWQADHSQGSLPSEVKKSWIAQLIAGAKQCQNPYIPQIEIIEQGALGLIEKTKDMHKSIILLEQQNDVPMLTIKNIGQEGKTMYIIGPEGGYSARELEIFLNADILPASLGQRVLRCETAALLCLGIHWWAAQQEKD